MPDLPDLEAVLRATRPAPDPGWAARLDRRATAGFPRTPWYGRLRFDFVPALAVASVIATLVVVAIVLPGGSNDSSSSSSGSAAPSSQSAGSSSSSGKAAASAPRGAAGSDAVTAPTSRAVRQDAQLTLTAPADQVSQVSDGALRVADSLG